ncbi:MAG TPA: hypothetical protein VFQ36_24250 [Ktedonobacteraceae bacterium]|nr:hypothetical protein [Ktedonobacteraceae bacterium]
MQAIREYNECDTFFHAVNPHNFQMLLAAANGKVEDIRLYGRVFSEEITSENASYQEYDDVCGEGYVFAMDYHNREHATPGTSGFAGIVLILGWDGQHYDEDISLGGEYLVPLSAYKVIGIADELSNG